MLGSSVKVSLAGIVDDTVTADYIVTTQDDFDVPQPAADAVAHVAGVRSATQLHGFTVALDGRRGDGTAVDGPLSSVVRLSMTAGSSDSSAGHLLIADKLATQRHWHVGTPVRFTAAGATPVTVRVTGIYRYNQLLGPFLVDGSVYRHLVPRNEWSSMAVLVHAAPGTDLAALRTGLERATDPWYVVTVEDRAGFKGQIAGQINGIIGLLYGLLGLALVIAVLGIVNTLALSVVERRREIGVLRAVGMQRAQVRRTIYLESLLIATFGAVLGVVVGITYGGLFSRALRPAGIDRLSIPITQNALFLVLAALVGVLAALWPAARAARTRPLDALTGS